MAATLNAVAAVASCIINPEKERCLLKAIRLAKNVASCIEGGKDKWKLVVGLIMGQQTLLKIGQQFWIYEKDRID